MSEPRADIPSRARCMYHEQGGPSVRGESERVRMHKRLQEELIIRAVFTCAYRPLSVPDMHRASHLCFVSSTESSCSFLGGGAPGATKKRGRHAQRMAKLPSVPDRPPGRGAAGLAGVMRVSLSSLLVDFRFCTHVCCVCVAGQSMPSLAIFRSLDVPRQKRTRTYAQNYFSVR